MNIDTEKLATVVEDLKKDINDICVKSSVIIGKIDGVTFELTAWDPSEVDNTEIGEFSEKYNCITR